MNDFIGRDKAVAGIAECGTRIGCFTQQHCHHRRGAGLAVRVGHMAGLGHGRCNLQGVAHQMYAGHILGFIGEPVDFAPAFIGGDERIRDRASLHRRQYVEHVGLEFLDFHFRGHGFDIDIDHLGVAAILDHAGIHIRPRFLEQSRLRSDVGIRVENHHFRFRFGLLQVSRDLAGALIGTRRATVRGGGNRDRDYSAVLHRLQLFS